MKKNHFSFALIIAAGLLASCNSSDSDKSTTSTTTDSNTHSTDNTAGMDTGSSISGTTNNTNANMAPLSAMDLAFVKKAATGGMMEVQAANIALRNSNNERVKAYASMMIKDHTAANNELKTLSSSRGYMIPEDSLTNLNKKHIDAMEKMKGSAFDKHYMSMMVNDHQKTVADFEKASTTCNDADLKGWAGTKLPTLKMHRDSAQSIAKMKM